MIVEAMFWVFLDLFIISRVHGVLYAFDTALCVWGGGGGGGDEWRKLKTNSSLTL